MYSQNHKANKNLTDIELAKRLSWLLRHGATREGLTIQADGFVNVESILRHPKYAPFYTQLILERIVNNDNKQRFMLRRNQTSGLYEIRANQGHSLKEVQSDECLERVTDETAVLMAVHGTYYRHWASICKQGLLRKSRLHVHFSTSDKCRSKGNTDGTVAISGFRSDCQILIYLDVPKVLRDGRMRIYLSANGVVLCSGLDNSGQIPVEFFAKVIDRRTGKSLEYINTSN